ncbi:MAG: GH25 family lysozyme [Sandaracinus sp.]
MSSPTSPCRVAILWAALAIALPGCAQTSRDDYAAEEAALTACHTTFVEGVDVSRFQGTIDWNMVHASGREFAITRIGDGASSDATFMTNYQGIHDAGMIRGAYLFFRPTVGVATQAQAIADAVGTLGPGDLPVTIDVECMCPYRSDGACGSATAGCASIAEARAALDDLIARVTASTGRPPMIYTGAWFWDGNAYLAGQVTEPSLPLWISDYGTSHYNSNCANVATGWDDWHFWQYSSGCTNCPDRSPIPGISGVSIDRDRWNGDLASLMAFTGGGHPIYGARYVSQSFPLASAGPLQIRAGESVAAWIELRNSGTADWDEHTRLATTVARDRDDLFVGPDWLAPNRLAGIPAGMTIPPGGTYRFAWTFSVPAGTAPGMYDEHFGLVQEGVAWFGDPGQGGPSDQNIEAIVEVLAGVDSGVAPDAAVARDAGPPGSDAAPLFADTGADGSTTGNRGNLSGGCGCAAAGSSSSSGQGALVGALALVLAVLRRKR